jgi:hypothetical protein
MHYQMLVTLTLPVGATSLDARRQAENRLQADDSFCGEGGRFGSPLCDWFVIGGRWSGVLKRTMLGDSYQAAMAKEFPEMATGWFSSSLVETHRERLDQLWREFGGNGPHPLTRNNYDYLGYEDDAMLVDQALYDHFLAKHEGISNNQGDSSDITFADLDDEEVDASFIGGKWLVVVDYHN